MRFPYLPFIFDDPSIRSIETMAPLIFTASVLLGTLFYMAVNDWEVSIAFYYATQVLLGNMYCVPQEPNDLSQIFTLFYFIWGTSLLAAAIGAMANQIALKAVKLVADERLDIMDFMSSKEQMVEENTLSSPHVLSVYFTDFLIRIGYYDQKTKFLFVLAAVGWYIVGIFYGVIFEQWTISHSSFCALSAMSANGLCPPVCLNGDIFSCKIGSLRALLHGCYIMVGVPLFAATMAQFVLILVEKMVRASELRMLLRPLTEGEYKFAMEIRHGRNCRADVQKDSSIDLGGFIVMELLRLKKVDQKDLEVIRQLFNKLDEDQSGTIDIEEMHRHSFICESLVVPSRIPSFEEYNHSTAINSSSFSSPLPGTSLSSVPEGCMASPQAAPSSRISHLPSDAYNELLLPLMRSQLERKMSFIAAPPDVARSRSLSHSSYERGGGGGSSPASKLLLSTSLPEGNPRRKRSMSDNFHKALPRFQRASAPTETSPLLSKQYSV